MPLHSVQAGGLSISLFKRTYWRRSPTYCDFLVVNATRMPVLIKENEIFDRESKLAFHDRADISNSSALPRAVRRTLCVSVRADRVLRSHRRKVDQS